VNPWLGTASDEADARTQAQLIWCEQRSLPGAEAKVTAFMVPASNVGWVDCEWHKLVRMVAWPAERHRVLADWSGQSLADATRQVIALADEWFTYCVAQAEREVAVKALAGGVGVSPGPMTLEEMRAMLEAQLRTASGMALFGSATPEPREDSVQGVPPALTGQASLGFTESPRDGLSDLGDHVAEAEVRR